MAKEFRLVALFAVVLLCDANHQPNNCAFRSKLEICKNAGWDITNAACLDMPGWDTSVVTDMSLVFAGASSFNIDISGWDTSSVTTMAGMFKSASSFNVDISRWDTSSVQDMDFMFWQAASFNRNLSSWDQTSLTSPNAPFDGCPKLSFSDVSECLQPNPCGANATCINTDGSFACACHDGFVDWPGTGCEESLCFTGVHNCAADATCEDTPGSFLCGCHIGFVDWSDGGGNGTLCDADQCSAGTHSCPAETTCIDTAEGFECDCKTGWTKADPDGLCEDVDECAHVNHTCDTDATCTNSNGSFTCACNAGFSGDGSTCADDDECARDKDSCPTASTCANTNGSFRCDCLPGYDVDHTLNSDQAACVDVDECSVGSDNCDDVNAACTNTDGSFSCTCHAGMHSTDGGLICLPLPTETATLNVTLAMTRSEFEQDGRALYLEAVAAIAGVPVASVSAEPRNARRRSLQPGPLLVQTTVEVSVGQSSAVLGALFAGLELALAPRGVVLLAFVVREADASHEEARVDLGVTSLPEHHVWAAGGALAGLALALALAGLVCCFRACSSCRGHRTRNKVGSDSDGKDLELGGGTTTGGVRRKSSGPAAAATGLNHWQSPNCSRASSCENASEPLPVDSAVFNSVDNGSPGFKLSSGFNSAATVTDSSSEEAEAAKQLESLQGALAQGITVAAREASINDQDLTTDDV